MTSDDTPPLIHPRAVVDSDRVGPGTSVAALAHIAAGAVVGAHCRLGPHVCLENGASLGDRVTLAAGARVGGDVRLGDDVSVGANTVITGGPSSPTVIGNGAAIAANATVAAGISVGRGAVVGAGAVLDHDVPTHAIVAGNPARITGYRITSPALEAAREAPSPGRPSRVRGVEILTLPVIADLHGKLTVAEEGRGLPFIPRRYFVVHDVPSREARGEHAHRTLHQLLTCVRGQCTIVVDDGTTREEHRLGGPATALHLGPMVWGAQFDFSPDAVLLVLASEPYDPDDYIRDYDLFLAEVRRRDPE